MNPADPSPAPVSIGEMLKAKREAMGLSLMDVAEVTKVSAKHLGALERNVYKELPSEVYAWLFLRTYAKHLGFNTVELKKRYEEVMHPSPPVVEGLPPAAPERAKLGATIPGPTRSLLRPRVPGEVRDLGDTRRWPRPMVWGLVAVGGGVIALAVWWRPPQTQGFQPSGTPVALTASAPTKPGTSTSSTAVATLVRPPVPSGAPKDGVLMVKAKVHTWIEVMVDGKDRFALQMKPGEEFSRLARQSFRLWIGYPPGVEMKLNGVPLTLASQKDEPLRDVDVFPDGRIEYHSTPPE